MAGSAARQAGRARSCSYHEPNASTQCSAARWTARLVLRRLGMGITPWGGGGSVAEAAWITSRQRDQPSTTTPVSAGVQPLGDPGRT